MKCNITVLISILAALIFSLSATCLPDRWQVGVLMASSDDAWNENNNDNDNSNSDNNHNGNSNDDDNSNDNQNDNDNDNGNGNDNGNEVKIYGNITSIDSNNESFEVMTKNSQTFEVLANIAQIKAEHSPCLLPTFSNLQVGHQVKAEGWWLNGTLQAYEVEVYNYTCPGATTTTTIPTTTTTIPGPPIQNFTTVKGKISVITPDASNPEEGELVVKGETIGVSSSSKFKGTTTSFSGLSVGQKITAKGKRQTDGKIKARTVKTK